jgi:hypothetical protein
MKTSTIIRFVVAALFATLACVGLLFGITGIAILWVVPWLLLTGRSELTKPIPRKEWWWTFLLIGVLLAVFLTLPFLHLPPAPSQTVRFAIAVPMWFLWMWAIYRRWQREKGKADA